jgi:ABC-type Fe3+ transport system substrate-binding protein
LVTDREFAIIAKAPHPNAAKLFVAWLTSEEGVHAYCTVDADSSPADPQGALGCAVANGKPEAIDFSYDDQRRTELLQAIGLAAH